MLIKKKTIAIVDDHLLFASSLEKLIISFNDFEVLFKVGNGKELQEKLQENPELPDIILLDINMPVMNGFETLLWLKTAHPNTKVLVLSMEDEEDIIIKMIRNGARGYLLKDIDPDCLKIALTEVLENGFYYSQKVNNLLINMLTGDYRNDESNDLKEKEMKFLRLACTEMTYKEIAEEMNLSPKTIDGYRRQLFAKFNLKNRVGLVLYALKNNFIS